MNKKMICLFILVVIMISLNSTMSYAAKSYFNDLQGYSWAEEYINEFAKNKIVSGVSEDKFEPGREVKREEFVKVIINLFGYDPYNAESNFEDVSEEAWYYPYVSAAVKEGIVNGISSTEFGAGKEISRQDMCVIIYRTLKNKGYTLKENSKLKMAFEDMGEISDYAQEAVEKLYKAGIINGVSDNSFAPKSNANRAQMVKVAYLCNKNKKEEKIVKIQSISFEEKEIEIEIGEEVHLDYTIKPENSSNKKVTWSTNSKAVVKLENGFVTGLKSGKATITIKTENGKNATCKVTVKGDEEEKPSKPSGGGGGGGSSGGGSSGGGGGGSSSSTPTTISVTGVSLNKTAISLEVKATEKITATVTPSNATNKKVTWSSSDTSVAEVENGRVTAKKEGSATITAKTSDGGKTATCTVKVSPQTIISVTGVSLNETLLTLDINGTATLTATVAPNNASNKKVTWSSSDSSVAKVEDGKVTALKAGSATITVKTVDGNKTATCSVKANAPATPTQPTTPTTPTQPTTIAVTGVSLNKTSLVLDISKSETLTATVLPSNATNKSVTWSSSDASVAKVENGKVTALKAGNATITVKTADGNKTATCSVKVNAPATPTQPTTPTTPTQPTTIAVTGVSLNKTSLTLLEGGSETLVATVTPSNASNKGLRWSISNTSIGSVTDGRVTAGKVGTAIITVTTVDGNKTATCALSVNAKPILVNSVTLNKTTLTLSEGGSETLIATINPANASNRGLIWSSSNTAIATVSNGTVKAIKAGSAVITVTTAEGNKTATCAVTVKAPIVPVTGITLDKTELKVSLAGNKWLKATVSPANATNKKVIWSTSDKNIAKVEDGKVLGIAPGTATITATTEDGKKVATCVVKVSFTFNSIAYSHISNDEGPINTAEHFEYVASLDCFNMIKGDLRPTKDGKIVMCHDAGFTLDKAIDSGGMIVAYQEGSKYTYNISDLTYKQCLKLKHKKTYNGVNCKVTSFEKFVEICKKHNKAMLITVRNERIKDVVAPEVMRILTENDMVDKSIINSFTESSLKHFRQLDSTIRVSYIIKSYNEDVGFTKDHIDDLVEKFGSKCFITVYIFKGDTQGEPGLKKLKEWKSVIRYANSKGVGVFTAIDGTDHVKDYKALGIRGAQFLQKVDYKP